uniref:Uncharacterized protein n=1 Tax=Ananas comosus var. bracteatus TaxID=296719 RepID=A0A6V7NWL4_ANACO|nr:unnamed protein product [Ananas comosus var. bracteatus]
MSTKRRRKEVSGRRRRDSGGRYTSVGVDCGYDATCNLSPHANLSFSWVALYLLLHSLSLHSTEARRSSGRAAELDFHVDVAPRSHSSIRLLPLHREEAGRGGVFAVLDVAPALDSLSSVSARTRRRNVRFRQDLVRWIQDFERNPRSPYLLDLLKSLIELDRDTLHTRLGSSHECHSGDGRCAFASVSLMPIGLALHGSVSVESLLFRLLRLLRLIEARASRTRALPDELLR